MNPGLRHLDFLRCSFLLTAFLRLLFFFISFFITLSLVQEWRSTGVTTFGSPCISVFRTVTFVRVATEKDTFHSCFNTTFLLENLLAKGQKPSKSFYCVSSRHVCFDGFGVLSNRVASGRCSALLELDWYARYFLGLLETCKFSCGVTLSLYIG
jgi:hypothetical protein